MFVLLNAAFAALRVLYAPCIADLDSPVFATRQAALHTLWRAWPLSYDACRHAADTTDSVEVRARAEHVAEDAAGYTWRRMMAAPADCWDETFAVMLADPFESDGLPRERWWMYGIFADEQAASDAYTRLLTRGIAEGWLTPADLQEIEAIREHGFGEAWEPPAAGLLFNFGDVRFRFRGLPTECEWLSATGWREGSRRQLANLWQFNKLMLEIAGVGQ